MKTLARADVVTELVTRLERVGPEAPRRWGTLTAGEMLCHLSDCSRSVLSGGARSGSAAPRARPVFKWLALYSPLRWPKGVRTRPEVDPHARGSRPGGFERDRAAAIEGLRALAAAPREAFSPAHSMFGLMSADDWRRWGYLHTDHHLRQFGA
ncbi:MAG: DUF1569 domain-containing protein [Gemmatimonadales bacterium]